MTEDSSGDVLVATDSTATHRARSLDVKPQLRLALPLPDFAEQVVQAFAVVRSLNH